MPTVAPLYGKYAFYDSGKSAYWDTVTFDTGTTEVPSDPHVLQGSLVSVTFGRVQNTGVREDLAMFNLHVAVAAGLGAYSRLDDTDAAVVETALDTFWTTIKPKMYVNTVLNGYVWRHWAADNPLGETGLSKPSPTWRSTTRSVAGTGTGNPLPPQVAETITFRTASRRHWGRIYLPPLIATESGSFGRMSTATVDLLSGAFHTFLNDLNDNARQIDVLVWSPKYRGALSITNLQMDDTFDVIRSRRAKQTTYRKNYTS